MARDLLNGSDRVPHRHRVPHQLKHLEIILTIAHGHDRGWRNPKGSQQGAYGGALGGARGQDLERPVERLHHARRLSRPPERLLEPHTQRRHRCCCGVGPSVCVTNPLEMSHNNTGLLPHPN